MGYKNYSKTPEKPAEKSVELDEPSFKVEEQQEELVDSTSVPEKEPVAKEVKAPSARTARGFVTGCDKLNLRAEPSKQSTVLTELNKGTRVSVIDINHSGEWFPVTVNGLTGFCMKMFIKIES